MFGISFSEILLIVIISLLIFGPEQLPVIARKFGKTFGYLLNFKKSITDQIYNQIGIEQINQIKTDLQDTVIQLKNTLINHDNENNSNHLMTTEDEMLYHECNFLYQPELDFDYQPELFDENNK